MIALINLTALIDAHRARLTATETRLADAILADPARAARGSAADVGALAGAHGASAVRLARKLGFDGFPGLRSAIHDAAYTQRAPVERLQERLDWLSGDDILAATAREGTACLNDLPRHVPDDLLQEAARVMAKAGRLHIVAGGSSAAIGLLLTDRLRRLGCIVSMVEPTPRSLALTLLGAGPDEALVAVALTRMPPVASRALTAAARQGMRGILIVDAGHGDPTADIVLHCPRGPSEMAQSLVAPVALVQALALAVSRHAGDGAFAVMERYGALRSELSDGGA